ncbi:MAG: hypothetical protein HRU12_09055 [Phaeodactylibacter sp.]|nr:hypothetical protein [Phaeodactylibacter sp.]
MKNLQDRLDKQGAPEFDREALWERIDRPKRRRSVFLWWFSGLAVAILLVIGYRNHAFLPELSGFQITETKEEAEMYI